MIINVGSTNEVKLQAVRDIVPQYPDLFPDPVVVSYDTQSPEFGHPTTLQDTVHGAIKRAEQSYRQCDISFGIEGGLIHVPHALTGYMEIGVCAIHNGQRFIMGLSPGYEWPVRVTEKIVGGHSDASRAFRELNYTSHSKLGAMQGGIIGRLTHGRLTRERYIIDSIIMALIQLENPEYYRSVHDHR